MLNTIKLSLDYHAVQWAQHPISDIMMAIHFRKSPIVLSRADDIFICSIPAGGQQSHVSRCQWWCRSDWALRYKSCTSLGENPFDVGLNQQVFHALQLLCWPRITRWFPIERWWSLDARIPQFRTSQFDVGNVTIKPTSLSTRHFIKVRSSTRGTAHWSQPRLGHGRVLWVVRMTPGEIYPLANIH